MFIEIVKIVFFSIFCSGWVWIAQGIWRDWEYLAKEARIFLCCMCLSTFTLVGCIGYLLTL